MSPGSLSPAGLTGGAGSRDYSVMLALGDITFSSAWPGEGGVVHTWFARLAAMHGVWGALGLRGSLLRGAGKEQ